MKKLKKSSNSVPDLKVILKKYQTRLRLQDWDISISYANAKDMQGSVGRNKYDWRNGWAIINVLHPRDNDEDNPRFHDVELTVVHELVHILLDPVSSTDHDNKTLLNLQEQNIEKLAKAIRGC